ncbi:hypothetical protein [Paracraurococcus lichenis]|uniref:Uncharacterized protein n=1 Tax=Paracraurococcus lichenis TaxID=3064888 RepID=A0ABT9E5R9_9PROT|nr:hypothetical protein [Paracraurococcus sp. LOR1-02]MDO9711517.1 hypothetical protein [Paracraurococcus sp. LOR1-02]
MMITPIRYRPDRHPSGLRAGWPRSLLLVPMVMLALLGGLEMLATPDRIAAIAATPMGHPAE